MGTKVKYMDEIDEVTPLDFLEAVYCNPNLPLATRLRAAIEAAPYKHAKRSVTTVAHIDGSFAQQLERAIERSGIKPLPAPKVINGSVEAQPVEQIPASELKKPFARLNYRRF
jgi:hypothetical protein